MFTVLTVISVFSLVWEMLQFLFSNLTIDIESEPK